MAPGMLNTEGISITQELLALLSEIDEFKGAWRSLGTIAPERLNALRRIATVESQHLCSFRLCYATAIHVGDTWGWWRS